MEALELARWQFGITTVYHFIFVPLTLGLSVLVAILQSFYYRTGDLHYKRLTKYFGKLFVIIFTLGIVTGIVQEFQFGMNWSEYSRFVGDIFGIPLAIEALTAFFIESTFLGLWIFGWTRLPKAIHLACIWLVAIASNLSAIWILMANSWMQVPVGYHLVNGRAELTDFVAILLNERLLVQMPHVILGGFITGGMFVLALSAWMILRKKQPEIFLKSAKIALVFTAVASLLTATTGHDQAQDTVQSQPMKMAAMEGLWETEQPASFSLFAIIDQEERTSRREIRLPYMLSVLSHNNLTSEVRGMNDIQAEMVEKHGPGDYLPPVAIIYWSFRIMVGLGVLFIAVAFWGLWLWWRGKLQEHAFYLKTTMVMLFLTFVANTAGWIVAEMGRQPWVVYELLLTADGVSPSVFESSIWISMTAFTLVYGILAVAAFYLIWHFGRQGAPEEEEGVEKNLHTY
ncbi:cytochrome ubiquinol oxidase subunit I [Balneolales bacterium ANBcel1]|nr:cytochrome ubiquinol oxidase subunit I [Balneolales bacterium ANBcel1]